MKKVLFFAFCLSLLAEEFPFPADSKHVSMATDSLGVRVAIWEEKGRILVSEKPIHGNWSMPSVLSSALEEATAPQLEIDSKGKATVKWVEGKKRKVASKPLKGEWVFKDPEDCSLRSEKLNVEKKRKISPIKRTIQPLANAIDAPTSAVLSGGQIGFAAGTAAPANGLAVSGQAAIGTTTTTASLIKVLVTSAATDKYSIFCSGTLNGDDTIQTVGLYLNYVLSPTSNSRTVTGLLNTPSATPVGTNTITNADGALFSLGGTVGSGAVTTAYSARFLNPTIGTTKVASYHDNIAIGFTATAPPTNGLIVSGQTLFKSASSFVSASVEIQGSDRVSFGLGGTKTATDGSVQTGMYWAPTFSPTSNTTSVTTVLSNPVFSPPMGVTITTAAHVYLQSGSQGGAGTVTTGYNLFIETPAFGSFNYAASIQGGMVHKYNAQSGNYTILLNDYYVAFTGTTPKTFTLPQAPGTGNPPVAGWTLIVKDQSGTASALNPLTISAGVNSIENAGTYNITTANGSARIYSDGSNFWLW